MQNEQFDGKWERLMSRIPINVLEGMFNLKNESKNKMDFIKLIRVNQIVKMFNQSYPVGTRIEYKPKGTQDSFLKVFTVKEEAFLHNDLPVCFFKEGAGYFSIETQF